MANMKNLGMIGAGAAGMVAFTFGVAGIAGAQDDEPTLTDPATDTVDAPGDGEDRPDRAERRQAHVDRLVEDGVITQEQADDLASVREAIQTNREEMRAEKQQAIADALGISVEDLEAAKEEGTSLADLAGEDVSALVDLFTEQATERINEGVADGRLTQEQADERLDGLADRIESRLENGGGFGNRGEGRRGHGRRGHDGPRGEARAAEAQETSFT
jgi:polyhydroxyalkanoate synthesis regulator phasin